MKRITESNVAARLNIKTCRCGAKIRQGHESDFFEYCSWECLDRFRRNKADGEIGEGPESATFGNGPIFGTRSVL
jgi:hypothetical protein